MKVTVIGSSTSWTERPMSCYAVDTDILVDTGEGTVKLLKRNGIDFYNVKHILITHIHSDHCFGLMSFLTQHIQYNPVEKYKTLTVYGPKGLKEFLTKLLVLFVAIDDKTDIEDYVNIVEIEDFTKKLTVNNYTISVHKLNHGKLLNIAYVFDDGKQKIGFSGDCTYDENLEEFIKEIDAGFVDCAGETTSPNHLGYDKFTQIQKMYPNKRLIAIHSIDRVFLNAKELGIEVVDSGDKIDFFKNQ